MLEEKELSDAMKDLGLGTPATRAQIIETLLRREYVIRQGKSLEATDKGIGLVSVVHPEVKSPAMTGEWEAKPWSRWWPFRRRSVASQTAPRRSPSRRAVSVPSW